MLSTSALSDPAASSRRARATAARAASDRVSRSMLPHSTATRAPMSPRRPSVIARPREEVRVVVASSSRQRTRRGEAGRRARPGARRRANSIARSARSSAGPEDLREVLRGKRQDAGEAHIRSAGPRAVRAVRRLLRESLLVRRLRRCQEGATGASRWGLVNPIATVRRASNRRWRS